MILIAGGGSTKADWIAIDSCIYLEKNKENIPSCYKIIINKSSRISYMLKEIMYNLTVVSILTIVNSFLLVYYIIPKIIVVIKTLKLNDNPDKRSSHSVSTPTMAGVSFFVTLIMTMFFIQNFDRDFVGLNLIASSTLIFIVGLKDDLVTSSPLSKLVAETLAILFLLSCSSMQVPTLHGFLGIQEIPLIFSYVFIILLLLTIINAFNLIDGIDGLATSIAIIIFSIYALIFFSTNLYFYFLICLSLIGVLLAYLNFNFSSKRKIFMGDTGSLFIGFFIGICTLKFLSMDASLLNHFSFKPENKLIVIAVILCIPLFDLFRVIGIRLYLRKSPFSPDRNHMHHLLIDSGFSHFKAAMLLGFSNYMLVILIIWLSSSFNSFRMIMVLGFLFVLFLFIFNLIKNSNRINKNEKDIQFKDTNI